MSLHNLAQQKAQRRDALAATQAQKDAAKAQREQEKQDEAAELESKHVLCETMCACDVVPCEVAKAKCCPTCLTIAESDRACGKVGTAGIGGLRVDLRNWHSTPHVLAWQLRARYG
ncbi:hypothetical protein T492DRAFT_854772 [Pavlovales sp. CCMP2436]|nr:hypothetical protein T492DRAFT_854772 [Pavlovales sp. CCMP2436]